LVLGFLGSGGSSCAPGSDIVRLAPQRDALAGETRLRNIRQLTPRGENAEAYFSADGRRLIFQSRGSTTSADGKAWPECDQIFIIRADGRLDSPVLVSTGKGRTTCAYFYPDGSRILFASTHLGGDACPPQPQFQPGRYVWPVYRSYDIFSARPDGSDLQRLTDADGYDAEATIAPDGSLTVFTSARDGDLELYTMKLDGSDERRITRTLGYDGGAFFSYDSRWLCFRASRPASEAEARQYRDLLAEGLVEPSRLEIFICRPDGSEMRQITQNGAANFCPFFHPSGKRIIYASNQLDPRKRNFDLFLVDLEGGNEERITFDESFDGFPMFSPDGAKLVWCSNRFAETRGDTNVFLADWAE
jgi:Tol biopolymer transport system component